ncbi:MAG: hypothetical protein II323_02440 [Tidjanibacter sp.]|nr:hypothetical protein [Tidjanibacter sp.]
MERYSLIETKMPREFILLQGSGCRWRRCTFCDYHTDTCDTPFDTNRAVLEQVTGRYGVLDVINSGSAQELDPQTLDLLARVVREKQIHTLWFESHWIYRHHLAEFAARFPPARVRFRCGVESFDGELRESWNKGVPSDVTAEDVARYFDGVCLLVGTEGGSREQILSDVTLAREWFDYFSVNVFCPNTTATRRDDELVEWFAAEVVPWLSQVDKCEILMENTDLGVG